MSAMTTDEQPSAADETATSEEKVRSIVSRVLSLSIFFVGVGVFAAIGLAMNQAALFGQYQLTYFAVGVAVGVVGLLLWVLTR